MHNNFVLLVISGLVHAHLVLLANGLMLGQPLVLYVLLALIHYQRLVAGNVLLEHIHQ